jgi:putative ABC transport system permease protein
MYELFRLGRAWRRFPGYFVASILTLALGIGATSAAFTVLNGALFKPLPIREPERVYMAMESNPEKGFPRFPTSPLNLADWERQNTVFENIGAMSQADMTLTGLGPPERLAGFRVSTGYFPAVGLEPVLGRFFAPEEDRPGGDSVVVLGEGFWKQRYASDPGVLGKTLTIDGNVHTIIGVSPSMTQANNEVWLPLAIDSATTPRDVRFLIPVARLKPNVTPEQAQSEMKVISQRLAEQYPETNAGWHVALDPMQEQFRAGLRPLLWAFFGMVLIVLLIACSNVAHLQFARVSQRERELALRVALGAKRGHLVRLVVVESIVLALVGGGLGILLAIAVVRAITEVNAGRVPLLSDLQVAVDARVILFTLGLSLVAGLVSGLIPALTSSRSAVTDAMMTGRAPASTPGARNLRLRNLLVLMEVGLALVLLIGAGLLFKSFRNLQTRPLGFQADGVLAAKLSLPKTRYAGDPERAIFYRQALTELASVQGAEAVSLVSPLPVAENTLLRPVALEGKASADPGDLPQVYVRRVGPGYFRALEIPLLAGRVFTLGDDLGTLPVAVVNDTMARRLWPGQNPIGQRLSIGSEETERVWLTVVGRVGDVRFGGPHAELEMELYSPLLQDPPSSATILVRAAGKPEPLTKPVRETMARLDGEMPLYDIRTLNQVLANEVERPRLTTSLFGFFSGLAVILASVGLYGLIAFSLRQREREIGIRMALGAQRAQTVWLILRQTLRPVVLGLILGLGAAAALGRFLASLLFGVKPVDPAVMAAAVAALGLVALIASLPALKATRVQPSETLRCE